MAATLHAYGGRVNMLTAAWNTKGNPPAQSCQRQSPKVDQRRAQQIVPAAVPNHEAAPLPLQPASVNQPSPQDVEVASLLRSASLGHLLKTMRQQGVTVPALRHFSVSDFFAEFNMTVSESHALLEAMCPSASAPSRVLPGTILRKSSVRPSSHARPRNVSA